MNRLPGGRFRTVFQSLRPAIQLNLGCHRLLRYKNGFVGWRGFNVVYKRLLFHGVFYLSDMPAFTSVCELDLIFNFHKVHCLLSFWLKTDQRFFLNQFPVPPFQRSIISILVTVPHRGIVTVCCGHCHPEILSAIEEQNKLLQHASTIYLHHAIADFAEGFAVKMPENLRWCILLILELKQMSWQC
ncbi:hypothetical protein L1987_45562 [Smallanthus sonchifolius]|uniref:Uncharacterized protein n=1 Tax=Smallanthus sonchifolius TaxID=185202 RepID=A0ACB9FX66_9ASTR|nr:hypothetical protein L1987_45562 [Smallanthus sonchifolius]